MKQILSQVVSQFNLKPTWDIFIILFFVVAAFVYGMKLGRNRVVVILVSIYMALGVVTYAPFLNKTYSVNLAVDQNFLFKISTFVVLFLILFFFISRSALLHTIATSHHTGKLWQVMLFSILQVGLLVTVVLSFLPASSSAYLSPLTKSIFLDELPRFGWIIAPILAMIFVKSSGGDRDD